MDDFIRCPSARSAGCCDTTKYLVLMFVSAIDDPPSTTVNPYRSAAASEQMTAMSAAPLVPRSIAHCAEFSPGTHANATSPRALRCALRASRNFLH